MAALLWEFALFTFRDIEADFAYFLTLLSLNSYRARLRRRRRHPASCRKETTSERHAVQVAIGMGIWEGYNAEVLKRSWSIVRKTF